MPKRIDIEIGKRYGRYTVLSKDPERDKWGRTIIICKCDCGNIKSVGQTHLRRGTTKSCGCLRKEVRAENNKKHGDSQKKSEHYYLFRTWRGIKWRCFNPNDKNYIYYGGRGITMHEPWINDYVAFKTWILENLGERKDGESIDRINVDENYIPGNLRWANIIIQANNKRNNIKELDIVGKKFGRWEIISSVGNNKQHQKVVLCKCECGKLKEVKYSSIKDGYSKSCGCLRKELNQRTTIIP